MEEVKKDAEDKEPVPLVQPGELKPGEVKVGWWVKDNLLHVVAPLQDGYMSLGILCNAMAHVNDRITAGRMQKKMKTEHSMTVGRKESPANDT